MPIRFHGGAYLKGGAFAPPFRGSGAFHAALLRAYPGGGQAPDLRPGPLPARGQKKAQTPSAGVCALISAFSRRGISLPEKRALCPRRPRHGKTARAEDYISMPIQVLAAQPMKKEIAATPKLMVSISTNCGRKLSRRTTETKKVNRQMMQAALNRQQTSAA